jgi:hypothetical protein
MRRKLIGLLALAALGVAALVTAGGGLANTSLNIPLNNDTASPATGCPTGVPTGTSSSPRTAGMRCSSSSI